ncbi:polymer-forming cytoskeletal protein [Pseudenhygromyxa sp. WMMC2535]|uniref:bactofilin family protein n=1 Tax=Pseudenhygromyxa sp. WMMC2535 TaxID=2712867 RepID=UPI0015563503|nr:polymer-forming cytoskeletal protein [Pseudenhygromyxa sp. WMMC2535]NVB36840.1 polymer-forming cytoskeletal protein [Pseudenhygromyxa sp. WMMC2535]
MATPRTGTEEGVEETVVGPAIAVRGRVEGEEDLRVEGRVEGSISLTETLYVEPEGVVLAEVEARDVVVSGIVIGDVTASNSITLNKGAKLVGNVRAPRLIIADGASFRGDVTMGADDQAPAPSRTRATATVPRGAISGSSTRTRGRAVSGSLEARRTPPARPTASTSSTPAPRAAAPARAAAPQRRSADEDDVTVVIKHAALRKGEAPPEEEDEGNARRRRAKKSARMPARGRRKAGRRGKD